MELRGTAKSDWWAQFVNGVRHSLRGLIFSASERVRVISVLTGSKRRGGGARKEKTSTSQTKREKDAQLN